MNLHTVALTPWRAAQASLRWVVLGVFAACLVGAIAIILGWDSPNAAKVALLLYGGGTVYLWAFFMPASFLLAYDARQLRLPRMERTVIVSLVLSAAATVAGGAALFGQALGMATAVAVSGLAVASGFAFSLLPRYLSTFMGLLPALMQFGRRIVPIPGLADPRAALWYGALAMAFALGCVVCWRRWMARGANDTGLAGPMVMQLRRNGGMGSWGTGSVDANQRIRQRPTWLEPEAELRHTGPASPVTTLRVALGGWFVPQTWRGLCRQGLTIAGPIVLFAVTMVLIRAGNGRAAHWRDTLEGFAIGLGSVLCVSISLGAPVLCALMLRQRWSTPQRELSLLGVLPGFGSAKQARRALLRAALGTPLAINAGMGLIAMSVAAAMHLSTLASLALVSGPLLSAAAGVAFSLDALGGKPLPGWGFGVTSSFLTITVLTSGITALLASQLRLGGAWATAPTLWSVFGAMVVLLAAMLLWIGRRGVNAVRQQPHPFLAHA